MKNAVVALVSFLAIFFFSCANAWYGSAHQVVAHIAYQQLNDRAKQNVDKLIATLQREYPEIDSFDTAAAWMDTLRGQRIESFTHWHYIDIPIIEPGSNVPQLDTDNAVWALEKIAPVLQNTKANIYERARFLAMFIHIVGDIHQPLHTVALYSKQFPDGDRGGNAYRVRMSDKRTNLHAIWDSGLGIFEFQPTPSQVARLAQSLMSQYPKAYFGKRIDMQNPTLWVEEGMNNAKNYVYITPYDQNVSPQYIEGGKRLSEEQVTLAGYRLGQKLNQLLSQ